MNRKYTKKTYSKKRFWQTKEFNIILFLASTLLLIFPIFFKQQFQQYKTLGLLGIFLINFLGSETIFAPSLAIFAVGFATRSYNPFLLAAVAGSGSALGEIVSFVVGASSRRIFNLHKHKFLSFINSFFFKKYGAATIIVTSFLPNPLFDGIAILAGIASYSIFRFFLLVFLGRFLRNLLIAYAGHLL